MRTLRQVWQLIRHDKLFSAIYIFGTALALATTTVIAVIFYTKVAPVYPEYKRADTYYFESLNMQRPNGSSRIWNVSYDVVRDFFYNLENASEVSAYFDDWEDHYAQSAIGGTDQLITFRGVDPAFFGIYEFDFLAGKPFSQADFDSGIKSAVITERTARDIFGAVEPADVIGRYVSVDFKEYKITGVVRQGTPTEESSFGNVYVPFTTIDNYAGSQDWPLIGNFKVLMVSDKPEALRQEVQSYFDRFNNSQDEYTGYIYAQPVPHVHKAFSHTQNSDFNLVSDLMQILLSLLALMLVPALNLSGMISGRMEGRLAEMGVRKSFGATRGRLLRQVLWENLFLTLAGGVLGYALAWIFMSCGGMDMFVSDDIGRASEVTGEMIFAPAIFGFVFIASVVLNVMSALIPAWRSLRHPIVESLKEK